MYAFLAKEIASPATGTDDILGEVDRYLADPDITTQSILKYPCAAEVFLRDSALPSSAAVERLFSCSGQILVPRRWNVGDDMFQKLVFLGTN